MITRRDVLVGSGAVLLSACASSGVDGATGRKLADIEATLGGQMSARLGVCAINSATGEMIAHRGQESFAMASTFKWTLAAAMLKMSESGALLDQRMLFSEKDLLDYAPVTRARFEAEGRLIGDLKIAEMSVEELCAAAVMASDNTAANLLLAGPMMGPGGLTRFYRENGDGQTRLDRNEPELNANTPGDPRDTTTPEAMARLLEHMLVGGDPGMGAALSPASRAKLTGWMEASNTGLKRLRAGVPAGWRAGDKTGTGANGAFNDVAIVWPPSGQPIVIACYQSEGDAPNEVREKAHADVARLVVAAWG